MKKRVLIFALAYHPFVGGAEVAIKEITDRFGDDFKFEMITANLDGRQKEREKIGNIKVYRIGQFKKSVFKYLFKYLFPYLAYKKAQELHQDNKYDIIWAMMANQAGWAAKKFKKKNSNIKYLLTLQEGDSEFDIWWRTWFMRPLYKNIYRTADYIQAISNFLAKRAKKLGAKCPVEVVPNGIKQVKSIKRKVKRRQVITVSRLVKKNGVEDLIKAMRGVNGELVILGDGKLRKKLESLATNLKVKFLGEVSNDEVYKYLAQSAVFVRPSLSEGLGNAFLEAMAVGVPVIATPVGGILDFLRDGETGWFCKVKDPQSIAEKINYILDEKNKKAVDKAVDNARQLVKEKYNWNKIAGQINNIFKKITISNQQPTINSIVIAADIFPPDIGGPATYSYKLAKELIKRGWQVQLVCYSNSKYEDNDPEHVHRIVRSKIKPLHHLKYFLKLKKLAQTADLIYAMGPVSAGVPAMKVAKKLNKKFVVKVVGDYAWEQARNMDLTKLGIDDFQKKDFDSKIGALKGFEKVVCRSADKIITPSQYLKNIVAGWGVDENKIEVIYNGVEFDEKIKSTINNQQSTIISVGRLVPWKGFKILIELMTELPNLKLKIFGSGPDKDKLNQLVNKLNLSDRVEIKQASHQELLKILSTAGLFVLNTGYEGLPHTVLEAMLAGVPVITTNVGGNSEVIKNGENGLLVEYNNKEQLKSAILKLHQDKELRTKFVQNSKQVLEQKFQYQTMLDHTEQILKEI